MQDPSWFYPGPFSLVTAHCLLTQASLWLWPHCHNKQITLFSESRLQVHVSRGPQDFPPWVAPCYLEINMLELKICSPNLLPHCISVCITLILPHVLPRTLECILSSLLYPLYPINHSVLLIPPSKGIVNGFVSPSALLIPCTSHYALSPGYSNNLLTGLSPFSLLWNVDILFFKSQNQGFLRSVLI